LVANTFLGAAGGIVSKLDVPAWPGPETLLGITVNEYWRLVVRPVNVIDEAEKIAV